MKLLKSLLVLSIATAISTSSFAELNKKSTKIEKTKTAQVVKKNVEKITHKAKKEKIVKNTNKQNKFTEKKQSKTKLSKQAVTSSQEKTKKMSKIVNINTATEKELQNLAGIGPKKAKAIINYRKKVGKIKDISELSNVQGIGNTTIQNIKSFLKL